MTERITRPNRRRVLGLAAGLAGGISAPALIGATAPVTWRMATAWRKGAPGVDAGARRLADWIATLSGGRLVVRPFAAGELAVPGELLDAVSAGTVELAHGSSAAWRDRDPAFDFFSGVPFGLLGHEHAGWLGYGGGQSLWERAYEPFDVLPFFAGSFGILAAGWFREPLSRDTVKGLTMRTDGLNAEIWRRLGVNVVALSRDAIGAAFANGSIDAAEWQGPWADNALDLSAVARNYYMPGFSGLGRAIELIVNRPAFESLPDDLRAVVRAAAAVAGAETTADFAYNNIATLAQMAGAGVSVGPLPDVLVRAAAIEATALLKEIAATSPIAGEAYESFVAYRAAATTFASTGDEVAVRMRAVALSA